MLKWLRRIWREWWGTRDKIEVRVPELRVINNPDYAVNQQQLDKIEKRLRAGDRPRGAA